MQGKFFTIISTLTGYFKEYAEAYDLPEVKLAIVHCAGQYDEAEVQGFWQEIIEKEVRFG